MDPAARPGALPPAQPQPQRLPLYMQISELLAREIAAGRWLPGARLPTEADLAARLGVAIGTLRKALADLAARGQLDRRQGSGTYVRQPAAPAGVAADGQRSIYAFFHLELIDGGGSLPTADLLSLDRIQRPDGMPALGGAPAHAPQPVWRVRRLRCLNRQPVALEDICFDGRSRAALAVAELHESLYQFYQQRLGFWIAQVEDHVGLGRGAGLGAGGLRPGSRPAGRPGAAPGLVAAWRAARSVDHLV